MKPHTVRHRVIYGDTDAMGIVYYGNYLRFFEIGRNEYIRARGVTYRDMETGGYRLPVREAGLRYHQPAVYDDEIDIVTAVAEVKRASIRFEYQLIRVGDDALLAEGFTRHACLDAATGKITRLPADVLDALCRGES